MIAFTVIGVPAPRCGTTTGYRSGCRCVACRASHTAYARKHRKTPAGKRSGKNHDLKRDHGITVAEYEALLVKQGGGCAICNATCLTGRHLAVDHHHASGRIRALLCQGCNLGIGHFRESPELLRAAAEYLS